MNLQDISLRTTYCSTSADLYAEIVVPLLQKSVRYDRAVGFFSSLWLKEVSKGLAPFVLRNGKARIVTSINLSAKDWQAMQETADVDAVGKLIESKIDDVVNELRKELEYRTLGALSWLIANNIIDFRFSVPMGRLSGGIMHSKLALFYDDAGNGVAVFGSQNDSSQASLNEETLSVFTSWGTGREYFEDYKTSFEEKWHGNGTTVKTYGIPEAARRNLIVIGERHQPLFCAELGLEEEDSVNQTERKLREYQEDAIEMWFSNDCQGLFEMATGSGKTFTSISAAKRLLEDSEHLAIIVLAPYTHLVEQWCKELEQMGFDPINCCGGHSSWYEHANRKLLQFRAGASKHLCLVATHSTGSNDVFMDFFEKRVPHPWLIIADEVHGLGAAKFRRALLKDADYRIGLSATASRWMDEEGTAFIRSYFKKTVIEYGLKEGIEAGALTPYSYFPVGVELTETELEEYKKLNKKISLQVRKHGKDNDQVKMLLIKRARLLGGAEEKVPRLLTLVRDHQRRALETGVPYIHNLYYCSPGEDDVVVAALNGLGLKVHPFVYDVPQKVRNEVLKAFAAGDLDGIVAIKCLDEGIDIPATTRAYILASTTNPREFVQRRGRLLRNYPGKTSPELYDFVIGPWGYLNDYEDDVAKGLLKRELPRIVEFNSLSQTKHTATQKVYEVCKHYGLGELLYLDPCDLYKRLKAEEEQFLGRIDGPED